VIQRHRNETPSRIEVNLVSADAVIVRGSARRLLSGTIELWPDEGGGGGAASLSRSEVELESVLVSRELPKLILDSTQGRVDLSQLAPDRLVLVIHPDATGLSKPPVPDWSHISGARDFTAQSYGFGDQHARLTALGADVAGLSVQPISEQRAFDRRTGLDYSLISDRGMRLAQKLAPPTFAASRRRFCTP